MANFVTGNAAKEDTLNQLVASEGAVAADSTAVANTTTLTDFSKTLTLRAGAVWFQGCMYEIGASGIYSCTGTPTIQFILYLGGQILCSSTYTITCPSGVTNMIWSIRARALFRSVGATASLQRGSCIVALANLAAPLGSSLVHEVGLTGAVTLDTTGTLIGKCAVKWSAASASNTATQQMIEHKVLPPLTVVT
jgi:hypothetical protein